MHEVENLRGNEAAINTYLEGLRLILNSGVLAALRAVGRPHIVRGGSDAQAMAAEGAYSAGWNDCLEGLLYFPAIYLQDKSSQTQLPRMDFNGLQSAQTRGLLTKEEAHAIRESTVPQYDISKLSGNIPRTNK